MMYRSIMSAMIVTCVAGPALADTAGFLAGKKTYASDWRACVGFADGGAPDDSYTLDHTGIYGYEFSCVFTNMSLIPDLTGQGRQNNYIATASCSDDSGISRPDLFDLSYYENTVTVTSQNDYNYDLSQTSQNADGSTFGFINKQFELCQPD